MSITQANQQQQKQQNFNSNRGSATYLPERTTQSSSSSPLKKRPEPEREHVMEMLHSLRDLEGSLPSASSGALKQNGTSRGGNSAGPSTLHSLALYFATTNDNVETFDEVTESSTISDTSARSVAATTRSPNVTVKLPVSILTRDTIASYADLFNLNNAVEVENITTDNSLDVDFFTEPSIAYDDRNDDLDLQQSEGPLSGARKSNSTKLRELAQVFTHALSAYLRDPDTFKKVLTEIRPTEPPSDDDQYTVTATTSYPTTSEEYPSVTKEKDEVLDFSDDSNGGRRQRPITTTYYPTTQYTEITTEEPYQTVYTTSNEQYTTVTQSSDQYPTSFQLLDESLNEAQSGYFEPPQERNTFAYQVNNAFEQTNLKLQSPATQFVDEQAVFGSNDLSGPSANDYSSYFPIPTATSSKLGGFQNNTSKPYQPYGSELAKFIKPTDASTEQLLRTKNQLKNEPRKTNQNYIDTTTNKPFRIRYYGPADDAENDIAKAHEMFGSLNVSSSNTLMKVMKQADNNTTVRQLVLLLISHCKGPMNKTMEQEKEQLLDALLRLPVNEFTSDESREIAFGVRHITLPIGQQNDQRGLKRATTTTTSTQPPPVSATTYRNSRKSRKFNGSAEKYTRNAEVMEGAESRNSLSALVSDARALDLLRSLYSIAAKWGSR